MSTVLIIDDNPAVGEALSLLLSLHDIEPLVALTPAAGLALLEAHAVRLVIQDMNFVADTTSGDEGAALFRAIRARHPDLPVILLTGWTRLDAAVQLVKAGAADYLAKPWDDAKLLAAVENLLALGQAAQALAQGRAQLQRRRAALAAKYQLDGLVFASEPMTSALELACQVARAAVPVLITGPNGAGKERIASILHRNSGVHRGPFLALNCGALPGELIEAELFGAEPGAYTGATRSRQGRFEAADGGTLLLDEIGNLSAAGQMKLLRVLETGSFERLGSNRTQHVAVRVLSATNADLSAMVRAGSFREDLLYRLNLIEVHVPALAERADDVLPLAEHFLAGRGVFSESARRALLAHRWPGNVRELKNAVERAVLLAPDGRIGADWLGLPGADRRATSSGSAPAGRQLGDVGREAVVEALAAANGVVSRAAHALGLSRQALYRRMEHHGLVGTPAAE